MEPVELTVITRNKTKEGLDEIIRDTSRVGQTVEQVTAAFKARMKEQSEVVKQVEADIKSLEKQLSKAAPGKAKMELTADLNEAKKVLEEEKGALALLEKQVEQSARKHVMLRTEIRNLKEQMAGMTEGTEEYNAAMRKLGEMQDRMGDVSTQGRIFADDNKNIKATMDAVSGLTGAMTAGVGVASLFGVEQEKLAEIQTRLQAVMAITMGVQQVANTLNKDSYFTHVLLTGAKNMLTAATTRLAVALGISNVAAQALMATLTLGLSVVITGLIVWWNKFSESAKKGQRELNDEIDRTHSAMERISTDIDFDVRVAEAAGKSKKELIELRREAAKTALALADMSFDEVNAKFLKGDATKEQLEAARANSKKAWDELNKINQDATVIYTEELTKGKKKTGSSDPQDKADEIAEAELNARRKINEMTIALMKEGDQKKKELALKQLDDELARIDKEEKDRLKALQDAREKGLKVTPEQVATVKDQANQQRGLAGQQYITDLFAIEKEYADKRKKLKEEEEQSWIDYNKQYGTYQEKRAAITKDYENKIAGAKTGGKKASLEKEREEKLKNLDFEELKKGIDWSSVFGNLDKVSTEALGRLKKQLQDFIKEQKNLSPENIKELVQAVNSIELEENRRSPFQAISESFHALTVANKELTAARDEYNKALEKGTEKEKADARAKLGSAEAARQKAQAEATDALHAGVDRMREYAAAANGVLDILNELGVKTPEWLSGYMNGVNGMLDGLSQIDLTKPMSILTGGLQTIKGAVTSIVSLGGLIPGLNGADYSGYEKMKSQYEGLIEIWDKLIEKKSHYIDIDYGTEALKAAEEAQRLVNIQISRQRQLIKQLASSGASKGSHSLGYRIDHRLSKEDYQRLSDLAGQKITAEYQLWDLSSEQIEKILSDEKLVSVLDTVNGDFMTYLQNIAEYGEQLEDIANKQKEAVTGMGFDEFRDGYVDMLVDLDSTNEDFAKRLEKQLQQAFFRSLVANQYKDRVRQLYDAWSDYGKDGLTPTERDRLQEMQQQLTDDLLAERERMMGAFGWSADENTASSSQSGRAGAITTVTEETAGKIEGVGISIQTHIVNMDDTLTDISQYAYESIGILNTIAENTAFCKRLDDIADAMEKMDREGVKMK